MFDRPASSGSCAEASSPESLEVDAAPARPRHVLVRRRGPGPVRDVAALKAEADVVDAKIRELVARRRLDSVELVYALSHMARRRLHEVYGFPDLVAYARDRGLAFSPSQVKQKVKLADDLEHLPKMRAAFQAGELDWTKVREAAREGIRRGATPEADAELLEAARTLSESKLRNKLRRDRGEAETVRLVFDVPAEVKADYDRVSLAVRAADPGLAGGGVLAALCRVFLQGGRAPGDGSASATVVIHVAAPADASVESVLEEHVAAGVETRDGLVVVSPARVEEALCNAEVHDVRRGPARVSRTVPPKVARLVHGRDGGRCKVPECPNMGFLHQHHEPGRRVVGHDPVSMLLLCTSHHTMRHEGLMGIEVLPLGYRFTFADGSPPRFAARERGPAIQAAAAEAAARATSTWSSCATGATGSRAPGRAGRTLQEDVVATAIDALVVLELKRTEARELVRTARGALEGRGAPIDESALVAEALRAR